MDEKSEQQNMLKRNTSQKQNSTMDSSPRARVELH
jgi:hypothetical protein